METRSYFLGLNGLRAVAALWILAYHLHPALHAFYGDFWGWAIVATGHQGVDLFFVLSGFLVAYHHRGAFLKRKLSAYVDFLKGRLIRIYPLHFVTLLIVWVMVRNAELFGFVINHKEDYSWPLFVKNLFLIQAWNTHVQVNWNHFAWSISAQWFSYLTAPLFIMLIGKCKRVSSYILMIAFCCIAPAAFYISDEVRQSSCALFRVIGAFGAGVAGCQIYKQTQRKNTQSHFGICALLLIAALYIQYYFLPFEFVAVPFSVFLVMASARNAPSFLQNRVLQYIGDISYALYITQFIVLMPIKKIAPFEIMTDSSFMLKSFYLFGIIALTFWVAITMHHLIEIPSRHYLTRIIGRKNAQ